MMIRNGLLAGAMALTLAAGAAYAADSSTMPSTSPGSSSSLSGQTTGAASSSASELNLTPQQKKELFQAAASMPQQKAEGSVAAGSKVPSGVTLSAIPSSAKQGLSTELQSSQIAKLDNGDVIVANPTDKTVQAVITPDEANATTGQGSSSSPMGTSPSSGSGMSK